MQHLSYPTAQLHLKRINLINFIQYYNICLILKMEMEIINLMKMEIK